MKDRIEWTRMVSDCITGYRSAKGDADALPPRSFIRAWMNRNFGLQKIPGRLFRLFYRSDKEELNEAFKAGNRARKQEAIADTVEVSEWDPEDMLARWSRELIQAINAESGKGSWEAEDFGTYTEISDCPDTRYYNHRIPVECWTCTIDDFYVCFGNDDAIGYVFLHAPEDPKDGFAFFVGGASNGEDVNESYNVYHTFQEAVKGSIAEIIDCFNYWEHEVVEHGFDEDEVDEAFKAGNRVRKKESAADAVQGIEELHYSDIPVLNTQMNRLRDLVSPTDVKNIGGDAIAFYVDIPCDFEFFFEISIYPLEKTGIYSIHVMFNVEGLETYMYDGDEVDSWDLEHVFDRIVGAVQHPEEFEEYREGGYNG